MHGLDIRREVWRSSSVDPYTNFFTIVNHVLKYMCLKIYHNIGSRDSSVIMCLSGKYKDLSSDQYVCKKPGVVACAVTPVLGSKVDREMNPYSALAAQSSWTDELPVHSETLFETIKVKNQGGTRVSTLGLHINAHTRGSTCTCVNTTYTQHAHKQNLEQE